MKKKIGIIGSGFSGICAALNLIGNKKFSVTIIDKSKIFGGVMYSSKVENFYVDNGTHHFDAIPIELGKIIRKIMHNKVNYLPYTSSSFFGGSISKKFPLPDLSSLPINRKQKIFKEVMKIKVKNKIPKLKSMQDLYLKSFGSTASKIFIQLFKNLYCINADKIEISFKDSSNLSRLKFLPSNEMLALKKNYKLFDYAFAAKSSGARHQKNNPVENLYPINKKGLRGWCEKTKSYLKKEGVKIIDDFKLCDIYEKKNKIYITSDNKKLEFNKLIWSNNNYNEIAKLAKIKTKNFSHPVPLVFYTFITKRKNLNPELLYIHNFDKQKIFFRCHHGGLLSKQVDKNNNSFLTVECFTKKNSKLWNNPEKYSNRIWSDLIKLNFIYKNSKIVKTNIKKIGTSLILPKVGKQNYDQKIFKNLKKKYKNILFLEKKSFFRKQIYDNMKSLVKTL